MSGTTNFPGSLDTFPSINPTTKEDDVGFEHDVIHNNSNAAIAALQSKVGIDSSTDEASLDAKVSKLLSGWVRSRRDDLIALGGEDSIITASEVFDDSLLIFKNNSLLIPNQDYIIQSDRLHANLASAAVVDDKYTVVYSALASEKPGVTILGTQSGDPDWAYVKSLLHFDGTDGSTVFTDQVSGNTWTKTGAIQIKTTQSKFGGASLSCAGGAGNYLDITSIAALRIAAGQDFTIETFFYPNDNSGRQRFIDTYAGTAGTNIIFQRDTTGALSFYNIGYTFNTTGVIPLNAWTHVALSRVSGVMTAYVNGVACGTKNYSGAYFFDRFALLYDTYGGGSVNGYLDELRVTVGKARYTANFLPPVGPFPNNG